ncbi:hypothetical protein KR009_006241 [Drosophila setifemur]|nr:hypothetical protein KR009_006241 [Drosophila setifemur]
MGCLCLRKATSSYPTVPPDIVDILKKQTALNRSQIKYLYNRFYEFAGGGKDPPSHLYKYNFYSGLQQFPLLPTILNCMFGEKKTITFVEFAIFLSTFQAHSLKTKTELKNEIKDRKMKLLFNMYDHNKDGRITKVDLVIVVHKLFSNLLDHVQIMRIVDTMMKEIDHSDSNQISFSDFCEAFEAFDMTEMMVTWIPEFHGRTSDETRNHQFAH